VSIDQAHPNPHGLRQRNGTTPQMVGRYPDWHVLDEQGHWDEATREVVLSRVRVVPELTFFDEREAATLKSFCDILLAQDEEPRIPVLSYIDEKLAGGVGDGWQYYDLPGDGEVWKIVARGLDEEAQRNAFDSFADASLALQTGIVHRFGQGELHGGAWESVNVARAWKVVMRYACQAFYSHPWAWTEIGFGGPAYPRGYGAFGAPHMGERESWEAEESFHYDPVKDTKERGIE
jgi:gluconate 2-dehydrogenase subunit 3-like protein